MTPRADEIKANCELQQKSILISSSYTSLSLFPSQRFCEGHIIYVHHSNRSFKSFIGPSTENVSSSNKSLFVCLFLTISDVHSLLEERQKWWRLSKRESAMAPEIWAESSFQAIILLLSLPNQSKACEAFSSSTSFSNFIFWYFSPICIFTWFAHLAYFTEHLLVVKHTWVLPSWSLHFSR